MVNSVKNAANFSVNQEINPANNYKNKLLNTGVDQVRLASKVENNKKANVAFKSRSFLLLGAPAVGKGSLIKRMLKVIDMPHIDMGGMLRAAKESGSEWGLKAKEYMDAGKLVPDEIVMPIVTERLSQADCKKGFILDGFPRTVNQAEALDKILAQNKTKLKVINIDMDLSKQEFLDRVLYRQTCTNKKCGASYNVRPNSDTAPKKSNICDLCDSPLTHRSDDNEETAMARLATYETNTKPLIDYYKAKGNFVTTKASLGTEKSFKQMKPLLLTKMIGKKVNNAVNNINKFLSQIKNMFINK